MATTLSMSKDELVERAKQQMQRHLQAPLWSTQQQVALTCRILSAQGHDSGLAGQITARVDGAKNFPTPIVRVLRNAGRAGQATEVERSDVGVLYVEAGVHRPAHENELPRVVGADET